MSAAIKVFRRYEKKFIMDEKKMADIIPIIEEYMQADKYCLNGQTYNICNLYYDTEHSDVIRDSLEKPYYKEKLRLRSYGIPKNENSIVFIEIKKKINGIVMKRRATLTLKQTEEFLTGRVYPKDADYMTTQVLREIDYYLSHSNAKPSTLISYDRNAYFDKTNQNFRVTFDRNIAYKFGAVDFRDTKNINSLFDSDFRLMEVKTSDVYPKWFADLISNKEIFVHSFSKYGIAYKSHLKNDVLRRDDIDILSHI